MAVHWAQVPPETPYPASHAEQLEALLQEVQPVGHEVHPEAPAAEKDPPAQELQAALPSENYPAEH